MTVRMLIVDDEEAIRTSLADAFADGQWEVETAASAEEALGSFGGGGDPDLVLSDVKMPGMDGIELLKLLRERAPGTDVVVMTAYDDMPTVAGAMREGAADFISKPLDLHEVRRVLTRVLEDRRVRERARRDLEDAAAPYRLDRLVGRDPRMIEIYKLVGQLAARRANVLIRGETGTGKELIARAIHFNSPDAAEPFIAVNCTAIPETLLESELFGHVKGAFTGATADRRGRFALAGRGTVFLDEIGDTGPEFQSKLLRVLESGEFYPVGADTEEHTEARVIAATHRNLEEAVDAGAFRQDLYYRLRVVEIVVPPLRERMKDLPELAEHFVRRAAEKMHRPALVISREAMDVMVRHSWPGNVRELENTLTRAVVLAKRDVIRPEHLAMTDGPADPDRLPPLSDVEAAHVARVLQSTGWNKTRAAEILGVSRPTLNRMIDRHGLDE